MDVSQRKRPHEDVVLHDGKCPCCGAVTPKDGWWCADCLKVKVREVRSVGSCVCGEFEGVHVHA